MALVTGAGRGIGRAIALNLAAEGAHLSLAARSAEELRKTAEEAQRHGVECLTFPTDVSDLKQVHAWVSATVARFGQINVLVNNAGMQGPIGPLVENDDEAWLRTFQVNVLGTYYCTKQILPHMISRRRGKIINLSGGGAVSPRPNFSAYGASKAAVVRFTETLAEEMRAFNIQVNAVAPGAVNTRMLQEILQAGVAAGGELDAAHKRETEGGTPADCAARLVTFLASEASGLLTGKLISAPHDRWESWNASQIEDLMSKPWLTMRRIDVHTLDPFVSRSE
ncbi:MAG: SDR family oxidoreductase [Terracidiphilus sp.]